MSVRNLDALLAPKSVALIGGSRREGSVGDVLARNLLHGGFDGPILAVHPTATSLQSTLTYPSVADLPLTPDLAVIATPPDTVAEIVEQLGRRGTRAAVVVTAGFGETGDADGKKRGQERKQALLNAAKPNLLRLLGPNCVGLVVPPIGLNASFAHLQPPAGDVAFVTQSGAVATTVLDWAAHRGIGFSHVMSLGDMADVDFGDALDYLAVDGKTRSILLYVEHITDARKFMSAGRAAARAKPVIVIKTGRSEAAARAAASHTGALSGVDAVYDAAFRRAGMLRVDNLTELFDATATLSSNMRIAGDRLAILTNGGGIGVLATDSLIAAGGRLAELSDDTLSALNAVLPETWSHGNPVDIIGDADGARYAAALGPLLADPGKDAVLVLNCPTAVADPIEGAKAVVETLAQRHRTPVLTSWLGEEAAAEARALFNSQRIPTYETPGQAVRGFMHLVRYRGNQRQLLETPAAADAFSADRAMAQSIIEAALADGRSRLTEPEAKRVLEAYQIPVVRTLTASTVEEAVSAAAALGTRVALKIHSPDISHKSDVGGVLLDLETPEEVGIAAKAMLARIGGRRPDARLTGFAVQQMAEMPKAHELIMGLSDDPLFGPVLMFGQGGTAVELLRDTAMALPPLTLTLANDLMARTRVWQLLQGYRDRPRADIEALANTLMKLSHMAIDLDHVAELDINPLLASERGVLALDARIAVKHPPAPGTKRLAIRPAPAELKRTIRLNDGRPMIVRPILPEDEPQLIEMINRSTASDIRLRFFTPMRSVSHEMAARLSQIDYDREMALVATHPDDGQAGDQTIHGVVHLAADPDNEEAEYGVMVRSDLTGQGLGYQLMGAIVEHAKKRGLSRVVGDVLRENARMLQMASEYGFTRRPHPDDDGIVRVTLDLTALGDKGPRN
ncbi:MAG: bifunctional acetate--CoA ligase family protein/GNAT family N-acetyltransferase [Pseudomonadota bacterium]